MVINQSLPRIAVLISTFNGGKYLSAQLDSILRQEDVFVSVFARDDGSNDETLEILARYGEHWPNLRMVVKGNNIGPAASFLMVLQDIALDFDYYAFSDQDDIWLPNKLIWAVERLDSLEKNHPNLYCSLATCVNDRLEPLGRTTFRGTGDFDSMIFANMVAGNTLVMNDVAAKLIQSRMPGSAIIMHDWWCGLVAAAFGTVLCDARETLLYRQHQTNVQGTAPGRIAGLLLQLRVFLRDPRNFYPIHGQMVELLGAFGDQLPPDRRKSVEAIIKSRRSLISRVAYAMFGRIPRWDIWGAAGTRLLIVAGWY